ncbi:MAG TPA: PDZ domain-containing protein [Gemmatimonadaceae bacterium]|jgi:hypothetical protein|nr:PDZ domain-containing protein [Gemmatimonadaceae bacterium]
MVLTRGISIGVLIAGVATTSSAQNGRGGGGGGQAGWGGRGIFESGAARSAGPRPMLFGFALECTRCGAVGRGGGMSGGGSGEGGTAGRGRGEFVGAARGGGLAVWRYDEYPRVAAVVPGGAADRAGIREGDVLLAVDGMSITTDEGSRRFSELRAGDTASFSLDRAGKTVDVNIVVGRGGGRGGSLVEPPAANAPNFTTRARDTRVDVWSDARVVESTDSTGATILRVGNTVIRLSGDSPVGILRRGRGRLGGTPPTN